MEVGEVRQDAMDAEPPRQEWRSMLADRLLAAKRYADEVQAELSGLPRWQVRRRTDLQRALRDARRREEGILAALGGRPVSGTRAPGRRFVRAADVPPAMNGAGRPESGE